MMMQIIICIFVSFHHQKPSEAKPGKPKNFMLTGWIERKKPYRFDFFAAFASFHGFNIDCVDLCALNPKFETKTLTLKKITISWNFERMTHK